MTKPNKAVSFAILFVLALALAVTGCKAGATPQDKLENALKQQETLNSYHFTGSASLEITPERTANTPLTARFFKQLAADRLKWDGVYSKPQDHMEMRMHVQPSHGGMAADIPMIENQNVLYVHLPVLNKQNEYMTMDLASNGSKAPAVPNMDKIIGLVMQTLVQNTPKTDITQGAQQTSGGTSYQIQIGPNQEKPVSEAWSKSLTKLLHSEAPSLLAKKNTLKLSLDSPGSIQITVGKDGFIQQESVQLKGSVGLENGSPSTFNIQYSVNFDHLNDHQTFELGIPKKTMPFTDILKYLKE